MSLSLAESKPTMTDDIFEQFCRSLSSTDVVDEWLKDPFEGSVHSSPEIATPVEPFLSHPHKDTKDVDLDSPLFGAASPCLNTSLPMLSPEQMSSLFIDLQSLPAALSALASPGPTTPPLSSTPVLSPLPGATTPTFETSSSFSRKRSGQALDLVDDAALKRQKNTDAARRSRMRKVMKMEGLEKKVAELEAMNAKFLLRLAVLESEKTGLQSKEAAQESRIKTLESQLAEAHRALAHHSK